MSTSSHSESSALVSDDAKAKLAAALGGSSPAESTNPDRGVEDTSDVYAVVVRLIDLATGIPTNEIRRELGLQDDLNIDSLSMLDIAVRIEDKLGVRVEEQDLYSATTVNGVVQLIEQRLAEKDSANNSGKNSSATN